jgi:hypothetical protein
MFSSFLISDYFSSIYIDVVLLRKLKSMKMKHQLIMACLVLITCNSLQAQLSGLLGDAKDMAIGKVFAKKEKDPYAYNSMSKVHKKYAGKIKLSNLPIIPGQEKEENFIEDFKLNQKIYGIVFFKEGIKKLNPNLNPGDEITIKVIDPNGKVLSGKTEGVNPEAVLKHIVTASEIEKNVTTWTFELMADAETATSEIPWVFAEMIKSSSITNTGKLTLDMGVWGDGGVFTFDITGLDKKLIAKEAKSYTENARKAMVFKNAGAPTNWHQYTAESFEDANLNNENLKKIITRNLDNC